MSTKVKPKEARVCKLCGQRFFSNKQLYCEDLHMRLWHTMKKSDTLPALLILLQERGHYGAYIEGFWTNVLNEANWLEDAGEGYQRLSQWGKDSLFLMMREGMKHYGNPKSTGLQTSQTEAHVPPQQAHRQNTAPLSKDATTGDGWDTEST